MPGNPREMIASAERRSPVRIRIGIPPNGLGLRHPRITAWLDENCGANGWAMTPSGTRGVLNDALSIYFADAPLASAFVSRWVSGQRSRRPEACSRCATMSRRHGSAPGRIRHPEGRRDHAGERDERTPLDRYGSAWTPAGDLKCAFSDWYWQGRLL